MKQLLIFVVMILAAVAVHADEAPPAAANPILERRVTQLTSELRCLVCQNQSLADSHADLAIDLKNQVREMIASGKSDKYIRDYMVARYGDFVLYKPPLNAATLMLWIGPFLTLLAAIGGLAYYLRRRRARVAERELTPEERTRARALLDSPGEEGR